MGEGKWRAPTKQDGEVPLKGLERRRRRSATERPTERSVPVDDERR
jgi:hypothetical protein